MATDPFDAIKAAADLNAERLADGTEGETLPPMENDSYLVEINPEQVTVYWCSMDGQKIGIEMRPQDAEVFFRQGYEATRGLPVGDPKPEPEIIPLWKLICRKLGK